MWSEKQGETESDGENPERINKTQQTADKQADSSDQQVLHN